jgi:hypothetical protein
LQWVASWAPRDGLGDGAPTVQNLEGSAQISRYGTAGTNTSGLVTFVYDGDHVNHDWPATINNTDNWAHASGPASFNASSMIMDFFANYTL